MEQEFPPRICTVCGRDNLPLAAQCVCGADLRASAMVGARPGVASLPEASVSAAGPRAARPEDFTYSDAVARLDVYVSDKPQLLLIATGAGLGVVAAVLAGIPPYYVLLALGAATGVVGAVALRRTYGPLSSLGVAREAPSFPPPIAEGPAMPARPAGVGSVPSRFQGAAQMPPAGGWVQCPRCGRQRTGEAPYCGGCGLLLLPTADAAVPHHGAPPPVSPRDTAPKASPGQTAGAPAGWRAAPIPRSPSPEASRHGAYAGAVLLMVAGCVAVAGALLPWITGFSTYEGTVSLNGLQVLGGTDGAVVIALGILIAVLGIVASSSWRWSGVARVGALVIVVVFGLTVYNDLAALQANARNVNAQGALIAIQGYGTAHAGVSAGLYVIGLAAVVGLLGALGGPPRRA